jgi:hypothetical protein
MAKDTLAPGADLTNHINTELTAPITFTPQMLT